MDNTETTAGMSSPDVTKLKKREDYIDWQEYFMATAVLAAERSKDPSFQVGACIVNDNNRIVGIGYNGLPDRCHDDDFPWAKNTPSILDSKDYYVCHAEMNAIVNKNAADLRGCTLYCVLFPCNDCAKLIIQSGIKQVFYLSDEKEKKPQFVASKRMLEAADVHFNQFIPKRDKIGKNITINWDTVRPRITNS